MEINHHCSITVDRQVQRRFDAIGFSLKFNNPLYKDRSHFDIYESDPRWPSLNAILQECDGFQVAWTLFSHKDLLQAEAVEIDVAWKHPYPMPREGFKQAEYDLENYCSECGIGLSHEAPIRLRKEPNWGRRSIFRLFWMPDELFVKVDLWEPLIEEFQLETKPVHDKKGNTLAGVLQLRIDEIVDVDVTPNLRFARCMSCERLRYGMISRGPLPPPKTTPKSHIFKSEQYFGTGHLAYRHLMISNELYRAVKKAKLQRFKFSVCTLYPDGLGDPSNGYG
ncbi:MAG TPA: hypothetical protein VGL56_10560 [Fimbriimonadaceae bacterium]|jgi:hypothetical protein